MVMNEHRRILVVDDEPQITRVLRTSLSSQGYDLRVANDGETALEIMKDWTPDLVITDLSMPNMDGLELSRRIRAKLTVPIIVLSVKGEERTKVRALDAGADDYVTKPFGMEELLARVRASLRRSRSADSESQTVETHRALLGAIWGGQSTEQVEYLRVFVGQLRKKLEPEGSTTQYIVTEPWVGYRFEPERS